MENSQSGQLPAVAVEQEVFDALCERHHCRRNVGFGHKRVVHAVVYDVGLSHGAVTYRTQYVGLSGVAFAVYVEDVLLLGFYNYFTHN